jgi:hypothetical protein
MAWIERKHVRHPTGFSVSFAGNREGIGIVQNISQGGCQIESDTSVYLGDFLELNLHSAPDSIPIKVDAAGVRWSYGKKFGVSFAWLQPDQHERLIKYLESLALRQADTNT